MPGLQRLLGHSKIETTLMYVDELRVEELAEVLERVAERRVTNVAPADNNQGVCDPGAAPTTHVR